jgi:hypothetical protein
VTRLAHLRGQELDHLGQVEAEREAHLFER